MQDKRRICVCVRQGTDGILGPFDGAALEEALSLPDGEVTILSMGPASAKEYLHHLTRLGAKEAVLLTDPAFAGADTLATAYALSLAIKRLAPDLVFCGRQTLIGDTAQTGPMLSVMANLPLVTGVMKVSVNEAGVCCQTREEKDLFTPYPALLAFEKTRNLRLPGIFSKLGEISLWNAEDLGADPALCGLAGSPTRVLETFENRSGRRKCRFLSPAELPSVIAEGLQKEATHGEWIPSEKKLRLIFTVGEGLQDIACAVGERVVPLETRDEEAIAEILQKETPDAVLWASDPLCKTLSAKVAARLRLGLCADCTRLESDGESLLMVRPACSGTLIAKIKSLKKPAMATVRTKQRGADLVIAAGFGAKDCLEQIRAICDTLGGEMAASRKAVDQDLLPYSMQVGLTGKTVSPAVYLAVGISGAVHHIAGMERSGTVIAINPDRTAPVFDYADFGIVGRAEDVLPFLNV